MPTDPIFAAEDPDILLGKIKAEFPNLTWGQYQYIDAGWDHEVIRLDDNYIFRFPNSAEYRAVLKDEIGLLAFVRSKVNATIPVYEYIAADYTFAGYRLIQGDELTEQKFKNLEAAHVETVATKLAAFLTALHTIGLDDLRDYNVQGEKPFGGYDVLDEETEKFLKLNLSSDVFTLVQIVMEDVRKVLHGEPKKALTHGDIAPKHIIWNQRENRLGIIDFSDRSIADPAVDFAELYTYGSEFAAAVYSKYGGPKDPEFLNRAKAYFKSIGIHMLTNSFKTSKLPYDEAKRIFDLAAALQTN